MHRTESDMQSEFRLQRLARKKRRGFTLVEMLVAMSVIGFILVAAFGTVAQALQTVETSRDYARVAQILQSEMEDVRTMSWSTVSALPLLESIDLNAEFNDAFGSRYQAYRIVTARSTDQKQIYILVRWTDSRGNARRKIAVSWYTQNGLHDYYYRSF